MRKAVYLFMTIILLTPISYALAADTDIYVLDQTIQQVPPDVLILLDLSGSMNDPIPGEVLYSGTNSCSHSGPFYTTPQSGGILCSSVDQAKFSNSSCSGPFYKSSTPGFTTDCSRVAIAKRAIRKILDADGNNTINALDQEKLSMRLGYMRFQGCSQTGGDTGLDYNHGCNRLIHEINTPYSTIWNTINNSTASLYTCLAFAMNEARLYLKDHQGLDNAKNCRKKFVIFITDGADTMACGITGGEWAANQYMRRRETVAYAKALSKEGYNVFIIGFGGDFPFFLKNTLNWAAKYGGTDNPSVPNTPANQEGSYTITGTALYPKDITGCSSNNSTRQCYKYSDYIKNPRVLTSCTAGNPDCYCYATTNDPGHENLSGYAYFAESPEQLDQALVDIKNYILNYLAESTSYVAPVVPISQMESHSSMNRMYMAMFKPTLNGLWLGNLKKMGIADTTSGGIKKGDIIDAIGTPAITLKNEIRCDAKSYWSTVNDGGEVVRGGVGEKLANRSSDRNIFTYVGLPGITNLTATENRFILSNNNITFQKLGISDTDPERVIKRERIIKFAHGYDSYNWNKNNNPNEKRKVRYEHHDCNKLTPSIEVETDWILGAFIHSRPLVLHYANKSVIYAGANDGMLHAFNDADGEELWAFIPPSLLPKLKDFETNMTLQTFVDGSPKAYIEKNPSGDITKAIIIFGLRRGGDRYIALDVTNPDAPTFLWEIGSSTTGFSRLGQTWSTPVLKQVANGQGKKVVAFFAGGYDTCNDPNMSCGSSDQKGNAVFAIDILTGAKLWEFSKTNDSRMTFSIPSDIGAFDINGDGKVDRLYVGDMGGQLWRFDVGNLNNTSAWTGKVIFRANTSSAEKRKMFYPPDVSPGSGYQYVFIGTGDREHPKQDTGTTTFPTQNRLYAIKDTNPSSPFTESALVDVTSNILQKPNPTAADIILQNQTLMNLNSLNGWFITLENKGEKSLSSPLIYSGTVFFTTFTPDFPGPDDICELKEGTGRVYALQYKTGMAAYNYDPDNDITNPDQTKTHIIYKTDRSMTIGGGIPSQIVLAIIEGEVAGYIGIGGGVSRRDELDPKSIKVLYWRTAN